MQPNVLRKVSSSTGDQKHPDVVSLKFVYRLDFWMFNKWIVDNQADTTDYDLLNSVYPFHAIQKTHTKAQHNYSRINSSVYYYDYNDQIHFFLYCIL